MSCFSGLGWVSFLKVDFNVQMVIVEKTQKNVVNHDSEIRTETME